METIRITSLEQLKEWNERYRREDNTLSRETDETKYPIVLEWFLDWFFFWALLDKELAIDAFNSYVSFSYICNPEKDKGHVIEQCINNLNYWYIRAGYYNGRKKSFEDFKSECFFNRLL